MHTGVSPRRRVERAAPFERVAIGRVVINAGRIAESRRFTSDDVRFGRMEIPARRIDRSAQRGRQLLPRREAAWRRTEATIADCGLRTTDSVEKAYGPGESLKSGAPANDRNGLGWDAQSR
jgi:hypothetical protein